jgi:hypothetical protein
MLRRTASSSKYFSLKENLELLGSDELDDSCRSCSIGVVVKAGTLRWEGYENWIEDTKSVYKIVMGKSFEFGHLLDRNETVA